MFEFKKDKYIFLINMIYFNKKIMNIKKMCFYFYKDERN